MSEPPAPDPQLPAKAPQKEKAKTLGEIVKYEESVSVVRSGPLPEASQLAAYNQIIPNGADRIMKMAEAQATHRIQLEKTVVGSQQRQAILGQVFGLIIGLSGIAASAYCAIHGQSAFASVLGGGTLVSLVWAFLSSQGKQKEELAAKAKQMQSVQPTTPKPPEPPVQTV